MELKLEACVQVEHDLIRSNRTFMELKLAFSSGDT